ncbi:MAG: S9 family peptidase [Acidimicrobiia bacterium]
MHPSDIARLRTPSDPRIHPDGTRLAFAVSRPDLDLDRYERSIWVWDGSEARRFTSGPGDSGARWSPDGNRLAFLRAGAERPARSQAAVMPADGGEAAVITSFGLGVESVEWSPDGRWLLALAVTWAEGSEDLDGDERERTPKRITRFPYRFDNRGWLHDRLRRLWLVDPTGEADPRCLTPDDLDVSMPAWSPDGSRVAYLADRHPLGGIEPGVDVFEVEVDSGEVNRVADRRYWAMPAYRPDGRLHLLGVDEHGWPGIHRLYRRDDDGGLADLSGHLDRSLASIAAGPPRVAWQETAAVCAVEDAGRNELVRIRPDGTIDRLVEGSRVVTGFDVWGDVIVFTAAAPAEPGEVHRVDGDGEHVLTALNGGAVDSILPEHFRIVTGGVEVDAWVLLPPGTESVPVLVNVHGGPASQYGFGFFDEFQVYAGAGFGVVACNPRGSSGQGEEFLRAVVGSGWGTVDLADVLAVLEAALDRFPRLDPDRIGIMGGSYGGFLTAWAIASDPRFRSAVVERGLLSFPSFAGTSDIGPTFPRHYTGADYPDGWEEWWEKSPLAIADRITTPTLLVHAENDWRCPVEQAEQLFVALLRNGVEVELLRFPGEGHEMSRSGSPRHRLERFEAIVGWHRRFLMPDSSPAADEEAPGAG